MTAASGPLAGRRVLVVEDDYLIASEMEGLLRRSGAAVAGPCPGVAEALAVLDEGGAALDAAVLDVNLGDGVTAYPVADRLDRLGIPYVFATGNTLGTSDPAYRNRPRLEKPILGSLLLSVLAQLVGGQA